MKIIYCIHSVYNPGGMERVLLNKVSYLASQKGYEIMIVTTDQHDRPSFYPFPENIRMIDLNINYSEDNTKNAIQKIAGYLRRRRKHKKMLTELLMQEKADIVVSLYPSESSFLCDIKDGSKKVLELHFCKFFRLQYNRNGLLGLIDKYRTRQDERIVKRFDKFIVLTNEDKGYWGNLPNIEVIPNAALQKENKYTTAENHKVIAVGRLDYQKGFDRLIEAWAIVHEDKKYDDWQLNIFGQGEWHDMLQQMADEKGLSDSLHINKPTTHIGDKYADSSIIVMSSHYEGLPMVLIEAMTYGVPAVTFDFKCGPKDIIQNDVNGLLVKNDDIKGLANAMMKVMGDEEYRKRLSENAKNVVNVYSEKAIMAQWVELFESLVK